MPFGGRAVVFFVLASPTYSAKTQPDPRARSDSRSHKPNTIRGATFSERGYARTICARVDAKQTTSHYIHAYASRVVSGTLSLNSPYSCVCVHEIPIIIDASIPAASAPSSNPPYPRSLSTRTLWVHTHVHYERMRKTQK